MAATATTAVTTTAETATAVTTTAETATATTTAETATTTTTAATATAATATATAVTATTTLSTLSATKLKDIDLFQVFVTQVDKLGKLLGELLLFCLLLAILRIHGLFSFLWKTYKNLLVRSQVPCVFFPNWYTQAGSR
jgi:hypothetical protein